ncbi:MAG: endonuclease domain-containing protein [Candidatus Kapabacteria bacterium]|nr:endonuclease domain-containing protein [Candidatus Kapabacteria bacterium]
MNQNLISRTGGLPYNPKLVERARELRKNLTEMEKKIWFQFLRNHIIVFHRQKIIDNFIVDFYCSKAKLIIEIDGDSHFTENGLEYDILRTSILENYNLKLIRFTNIEVRNNFEYVCMKINEELENRI